MQPYDLRGNPILINRDGKSALPPEVAPPAGVAPIAGTTPFQVFPPNVMGSPGPLVDVPYGDNMGLGALEQYATDTMPMGALDEGAVAPEGALMQPQEDTGLFSFLNKPGASDSLVAFGSAMLRGNTFNEGLANAADAVTKVAQQYRMPTPREIAAAQMKAQLARIASGRSADPPPSDTVHENRPVYGNVPGGGARELFYPVTRADGSFGFLQASTNQIVPSIENALRPEDDAAKYNSKNIATAQEEALTAAIDAGANAAKYEQMAMDFDSAGGGAGFLNARRRDIAEFLGADVMGVDVSKKQEVEKFVRQLELKQAQTQRGLGQLTEAEREIIRSSMAALKDDPRAFKKIMYTMKAQSERAAMLYDTWYNSDDLKAKYADPRQYFRVWMASDEGKAYEASLKSDIEAKVGAATSPGSNAELEDALSKY